MTLTRDGLALWMAVIVAASAYLMTMPPPTEWNYQQWLQTVSAAALWTVGKMQSSPAPSKKEVRRGVRVNGEPL